MRILTLVTGQNSLPDARRLTAEIGIFNAEIDFRLRFLHIEIEELFVFPTGLGTESDLSPFEEISGAPLEAAARLALLLGRERPDVLVIVGQEGLHDAGAAAGRACNVKVAWFQASAGTGLDLGGDAHVAVERLTGVAREIR